jgi:hypothetical protein
MLLKKIRKVIKNFFKAVFNLVVKMILKHKKNGTNIISRLMSSHVKLWFNLI